MGATIELKCSARTAPVENLTRAIVVRIYSVLS
jgi:hypothetical protein